MYDCSMLRVLVDGKPIGRCDEPVAELAHLHGWCSPEGLVMVEAEPVDLPPIELEPLKQATIPKSFTLQEFGEMVHAITDHAGQAWDLYDGEQVDLFLGDLLELIYKRAGSSAETASAAHQEPPSATRQPGTSESIDLRLELLGGSLLTPSNYIPLLHLEAGRATLRVFNPLTNSWWRADLIQETPHS